MQGASEAPDRSAAEERLQGLLVEHRERFVARFGGGGDARLFLSPGRVNLMGAHLDYNGGPVMPMAIDRGTFLAARARQDDRVRIASTLDDTVLELTLGEIEGSDPTVRGAWVDYPLGVVLDLVRSGCTTSGADLWIGGNLPIGAGLSSSASVCVGTAYALTTLWGVAAEPKGLIDAALWAEREFVGVQCGIMDPYAVTLARPGHLLWLDCFDQSYEHVPLDQGAVTIAVADTGVRRELAQGAFNERVAQCASAFEKLQPLQDGARCLAQITRETLDRGAGALEDAERKRAEHVIGETARAHDARHALREGDLARFGRNMSAAHESLREHYEVSIPELDTLVEAALAWDGVLGTRLTGAGFGGCIVVALATEARQGFAEHLGEAYRQKFGPVPHVEFFQGGSGPREFPL